MFQIFKKVRNIYSTGDFLFRPLLQQKPLRIEKRSEDTDVGGNDVFYSVRKVVHAQRLFLWLKFF